MFSVDINDNLCPKETLYFAVILVLMLVKRCPQTKAHGCFRGLYWKAPNIKVW